MSARVGLFSFRPSPRFGIIFPTIASIDRATDRPRPPAVPMVLLFNEKTASGCEIAAPALRHWKRAVLIGTATMGRTSIQTQIPLSDGSFLGVTTAEFHAPDGYPLPNSGIVPDIAGAGGLQVMTPGKWFPPIRRPPSTSEATRNSSGH